MFRFPTLAALCKLPLPGNLTLDGHDLGTVIASPETPSPHQFLQWRLQEQWAVTKGPWKLIHRPNDVAKDGPPLDEAAKQWFLVNLDNDPAETRSVAAEHPAIVEELKALRP